MRSLWAVAVLMAAFAATGLLAAEVAPRLDFSLADQFGEIHTDEDCSGAVVVLLGGDRKGSAFIADWGPVLHQAYNREFEAGAVCSMGFAHLKGAPFFVKKKIVASFSKEPDEWTLLDWKGEIAKNWGAEKDAANLYIFDRGGGLVFHSSLREFDQETLGRILHQVQETVAEQ